MKRTILFILSICFLICSTACTPRASILFNQRPITKENVMDYSSIFQRGTRVYYLIIMPEVQHSRYLNIQIIKKDNDVGYLGYKLFMTNTVRLKDEEEKYYTDYFVINEKGAYIMKVYSKDNPRTPLTQAEFFIQ